eukprot:907935-Amorphochlora_amoeboformis.AAC.1
MATVKISICLPRDAELWDPSPPRIPSDAGGNDILVSPVWLRDRWLVYQIRPVSEGATPCCEAASFQVDINGTDGKIGEESLIYLPDDDK